MLKTILIILDSRFGNYSDAIADLSIMSLSNASSLILKDLMETKSKETISKETGFIF